MDPQVLLLVGVFVAFALGATLAWLLAKAAQARALEAAVATVQSQAAAELAQLRERVRLVEEARRAEQQALAEARTQLEAARIELDRARDDVARLLERSTSLGQRVEAVTGELATARRQLQESSDERSRLATQLAETQATLEGERKSTEEKLALLNEARESLSHRFQVLANEILEEKSQKFAEQNKSTLGALLDPLRTQLSEFKGKVEEVYVQEGKDRTALAEQVKHLLTLNQTLSQDAQNLTDALKGSSKVQGAWGEWVLEEMLSSSGLMKDEHYHLQDSQTREDGSRGRPDALISLPNERKLVIDSKVSLVAYEQYASAESDEDRAAALRAHLESMRRHIAGLSDREYQKLYPTMDFVMMFIPLEPAFMVTAANDRQLFSQAWEKNVLLVSPSTLLFVLRTVAYLWRQEDQNRNAQAIADRGAKLYDKFCDFLRDMESVGQRLEQAQGAFADARRKLHDGNGNLISQAEKLTALGVKGSKKMPPALLQLAGAELAEADTSAVEELARIAAATTPRPLS